MTPRGWLSGAGASGLLAIACAGGQSGTELAPSDVCKDAAPRAVEPGEMTDNGTVEALAAEVAQTAPVPMRIFGHDAEESVVDTTLTLVASVARSSGQVFWRASESAASAGACETLLTARAVMHFDAADGSFMDVFDGTIEKGGRQTSFSATLVLQQHRGTLDLTALGEKNYVNPVLDVMTTLGSMPSGRLILEGDARDNGPNTVVGSAFVAEWP